MIKVFGLVLELLQISFSPEHIVLAEKLIKDPNHKIVSFYANWFVFFVFQEMLLGKISQEEFVALGDSFGHLYQYQNNPVFAKEALVYWLINEPQTYENSFILFPKEEKTYLEKSIPSLESILKKIKSQIFYM